MSILERDFINLSVIRAPLEAVLSSFDNYSAMRVKSEPTFFIFPHQPYQKNQVSPPLLLWSPACAPGLTAFMPSVSSGDYFVVSYAGESFGYEVASVRSTTSKVEYPINEFVVHKDNQIQRFVRAMRDSPKWEFYEQGEPLAFENSQKYKERLIKNRLVREDIFLYLKSWGAPVISPEFWQTSQAAFTFAPKVKNG